MWLHQRCPQSQLQSVLTLWRTFDSAIDKQSEGHSRRSLDESGLVSLNKLWFRGEGGCDHRIVVVMELVDKLFLKRIDAFVWVRCDSNNHHS